MSRRILKKVVFAILEHSHVVPGRVLFDIKYSWGLAKDGVDFFTCGQDYRLNDKDGNTILIDGEKVDEYVKNGYTVVG